MEVYHRIAERVRGSLWAHHRRLMPERQFQRILGYVYNNKYEYQIRLDRMLCVGHEWDGKVEVATTPGGHIKRVRVNPTFQDLPVADQQKLLLSAYSSACKQGREIMEAAEMKVYKQFLQDLKPIVTGIRDNPEFYTVSENSVETIGGTLQPNDGSNEEVHRTIPYAKAYQPKDVFYAKQRLFKEFSNKKPLWKDRPLHGRLYMSTKVPENRPRGAPGAKKSVAPLEIQAPYVAMDEARLLKTNWMAYLDNKHVAEATWTKTKIADREKTQRLLQRYGKAWHSPVNQDGANSF
eukprot:Tbor_TRINITY_DN2654_c1_g1::TRINITY_DN2654_c1_g1_i1::g.17997::m.17997